MTVLIGGNGAGKTTLLRMIGRRLAKTQPDSTIVSIDANTATRSLLAGGPTQQAIMRSLGATFESEGTQRRHATADWFTRIGQAVRNPGLKDLWLLFDGIDSGVDVNGLDMLFDALMETVAADLHRRGVPLHVVTSATTYEPVRYAQCHGGTVLTIPSLKPIRFHGYEDWRDWTIRSAKRIERREMTARKEDDDARRQT